MLEMFLSHKADADCRKLWSPLIEQAKQCMPASLPVLKKSHAKFFIRLWNTAFEQGTHDERIGLAVLAYRVEIHRYAAGMLIHSRHQTRLDGIRILGHMGDESVWHLLARLAAQSDAETTHAAIQALRQINEGRARLEFAHLVSH